MSIFITLLAFPGSQSLKVEAKLGALADSFILGYALLRSARSGRTQADPGL
ncbi:Na+/H+ antiporter NhaA [Sphingomonas faeni]|nr:Na+/H+ antiporter NhaA [Sphingomonas faeni]